MFAALLFLLLAEDPLTAGRAALERGDYPRAEEIYREYVRTHPASAQGLSNLGAVLARREKFDEAVAAYRRALKLDPKLTPIWFNLGVAHLRAGDYGKAVPALEAFLKHHPADPRAQQLLGVAYVETGDLRRGIELLEAVLGGRPDDPSLLYPLAAAHIRAGDEKRGTELLDRLDRSGSAAVQVSLLRGLLDYRMKNYDRAEAELQKVAEADARNATALAALGRLRLRINDDEAAIGYFIRALAAAPQDAESHYQLGVLLDRNGRAAEAREHLKRAVALRANYPDPMYAMAKIEFREGNAKAALALLEPAVRNAPEQEAIHLLLARTYQKLGLAAKATAEFEQVRQLQLARIHRKRIELPGEEPALKLEDPAGAK